MIIKKSPEEIERMAAAGAILGPTSWGEATSSRLTSA
jgi:hypothetical protein